MSDNSTGDFSREIVVHSIKDFLLLQFPPREYIIEPIIPTQGITMLYAHRGIGKTFLALTIACTVAVGASVLGWKAPKPRRVVYVDGEMSGQTIQERLCGIISGIGIDISDTCDLRIVNITSQNRSLDLSLEDDQQLLERHLKNTDLLILDNISTLTSVKENDADDWLNIQKWLIKLRQKNISVLLVHHAGKGGDQRGSSRKEDILDTVIALKRPSGYESSEGSKFEVKFEKCRGFSGDQAKSFEAQLCKHENGDFYWSKKENNLIAQVRELHALKLSLRDIAEETGKSKSTIQRILKNSWSE
jgi:putative DNA primase/helicase